MYESEYFFICKIKSNDRIPSLKPDLNTSNRNYDFEALPIGQPPLRFLNAWKDDNVRQGISSITPDVLFDGTNLVVVDTIRERLLDYNFPNLHIYPAIYVDDRDRWHEDRWFLTFTERFDCWDRNTSDYDQEGPPIQLGGLEYHQVYSYKFDGELLRKTPLEQRLLFKLGGTLDAYIVAHESVLTKLFGPPGQNGAEYIRVADY